jgi:hypothetical protein
VGLDFAREVGANIFLQRYVLEIAQVRIRLESFAFFYSLSLRVLLCEDTAEQLDFGRAPARLALFQQLVL